MTTTIKTIPLRRDFFCARNLPQPCRCVMDWEVGVILLCFWQHIDNACGFYRKSSQADK